MIVRMAGISLAAILGLFSQGCVHKTVQVGVAKPGPKEKHFKSLRQLTFEGSNAEAYFSPDGKKLIFQGHGAGNQCDQIFTMNVDGSDLKKISRGGRTTCSFFIPASESEPERILFSSTHATSPECPAERDRSKGYVWEIYKSYEIYTAKSDGSDLRAITEGEGYDAESTVCAGQASSGRPAGGPARIAFTSARSGDSLHIYTMDADGKNVRQLTRKTGYNGGPFFSTDCRRITYRAHHPAPGDATAKFKAAVREGYIPQGALEIRAMNADGTSDLQLTKFGASSFAPSFYPHGDKVIFSGNLNPKSHRDFHLWAVNSRKALQTRAEQVTTEGTFNGFPMFSPDGKYLVFSSNRSSANPRELQVFLAEWQD